jgi:hypothetical protein
MLAASNPSAGGTARNALIVATLPFVVPRIRAGLHEARASLNAAIGDFLTSVDRAWRAENSYLLFRTSRGNGIDWRRVRSTQGSIDMNDFMREILIMRRDALRQYQTSMTEDYAEASAMNIDGQNFTPEMELHAARIILDEAMVVTRAAVTSRANADGTLPDAERSVLENYHIGYSGSMALVGVMSSLVSQERFSGSVRTLLIQSEVCINALIDYTMITNLALRRRLEWMTAFCVERGALAGPPLEQLPGPMPMVSSFRLWPQGRSTTAPPISLVLTDLS